MAGGIFTIQEMSPAGGGLVDNPDGERFEWFAAAGRGQNGGSRAIPKPPWTMPGKQRVVRTDYPGARRASAQVLGPKHEPSTLEGRWDDRYNFSGYAIAEKRRFEAMCRRGNPVQISFAGEIFDCIITDWSFAYRRDDYIPYSFTIDNYGRPDEDAVRPVVTTAVQSSAQAFDDTKLIADAIAEAHKKAPASAITGSSRSGVETALKSMSANLNKLSDVLDTRQGALKPIAEFKKTATMFRMVQGDAANVVTALVTARADTELGIRTAMTVLDFESWSRGMRAQARLLLGTSRKGAQSMEERAAPKAQGTYRPHAGESLYAISRRFYGTPHAWHLIADRNGLSTLRLDGTELLIIPERGVG